MNICKATRRIGENVINYQECVMKIIKYNHCDDIVVEFQDKYKAQVHTSYKHFTNGNVKNPYYPSVYGVGIVGNKYPSWIDKQSTKEYETWKQMLRRCFDEKLKEKHTTYKHAICCDEWLFYDNFYKWLHNQPNFDKWLNEDRWELDKDILVKGNKMYSPETCCLVPHSVNTLFTKHDLRRGKLPIGVTKNKKGFCVRCLNPIIKERKCIGTYATIEEAFCAYKQYKENIIKQVAQIEFDNGNIVKQCYNSMMKYVVEIID